MIKNSTFWETCQINDLNLRAKNRNIDTVFENHRKSIIRHCERSLHFEWTKVYQKFSIWRILGKLKLAIKQYYQVGQF